MRHTSLIASAALAAALVVTSPGLAGPGDVPARRGGTIAAARLVQCLRGPATEDRLAVFRGLMRRAPGTAQMAMRFRLQERVGGGRFRSVRAPGLGVWHKSRPGVRRFSYRQRVLALAQGSSYRTIVSFRWYDGDGHVVRRGRRRSPACRQPGLLANLRVPRVDAGPDASLRGTYRYAVYVANRGRAVARDFGVSLAVDGASVGTAAVSVLAPGESRRLLFSGPPCGSVVTAVADPHDVVRESSERDNALTLPCPTLP